LGFQEAENGDISQTTGITAHPPRKRNSLREKCYFNLHYMDYVLCVLGFLYGIVMDMGFYENHCRVDLSQTCCTFVKVYNFSDESMTCRLAQIVNEIAELAMKNCIPQNLVLLTCYEQPIPEHFFFVFAVTCCS
jgi:hypothetical protein